MQTVRNHELQLLRLHLVSLMSADGGFERQEVLAIDPPRLREDLPPAILACCLYTQHRQKGGVTRGISIFSTAWKQEIGLRLPFCYHSALVADTVRGENDFEVIFEGSPDPALPPILDGQRKRYKAFHVVRKTFA